ncbi:MAG: hypothetical protein BGP06_10250 [Rhizobiales bacterium 65-9]|nr:MAPEG family protein [Hyphomicrobiales bacterium]OJY32167.1 MAG: hypothetical protein BGP06_10250 [Rhizobiales bacterium 65-9]
MNLIYPALAQIIWTFVVLAIMTRARMAAFRAGEVRLGEIAVSGERWPPKARAAGNNFSNQFETPVLFFALIAIAIFIGSTGWIMTLLAWIYVASRVVHTFIHTGPNDVMTRMRVFAVGLAALFCMLIIVIATLL